MLSQSSQRSGATIDTRQADADDSEEDDHVDEVAETRDSSVDCHNNEWRSRDIDEARSQKTLVSVWDEETDEEQAKDVEAIDCQLNV